MKQYISELLGTFALVFAGTGAIVINQVSSGAITPVGIVLTFGLVVLSNPALRKMSASFSNVLRQQG